MVTLSYYVGGIIATMMLIIFHNLLTNNPQKEFSVPQMFVTALVWPIVIPMAALVGIWHYAIQPIVRIFKSNNK